MGVIVLNFGLAYARLAWLTILIERARKLVFSSPTTLLMNDNLSNKENLGDFVSILINSWFGTKPNVSSTSLYE